jgi:hypothetical protein
MSDFGSQGWLHPALIIAIAALLPVLVVLVGLAFLRGANLVQKIPEMILIAGILFFIGYLAMGAVALKNNFNLINGGGYLVLAVGWLITGVLQYRARRQKPNEGAKE